MSGPGAPCVGAWRSLHLEGRCFLSRSVSGPSSSSGLVCVGARRSLCRSPALFVSKPGALCRGPARGPGALCVGPGALCVGARRSFYRAPAISVRVCLEPGLFLDWSSALSGGLFVSGPGALCQRVRAVRRAAALCLGARRCLCRAWRFVSGPGALSIGLRRSLSGCVWSPDCFSIGARRSPAGSLCRGPALCVSVCVLCVGPRRSVSGPGRCLCRDWRFVSGPGAPSECRGPAPPVSGPLVL